MSEIAARVERIADLPLRKCGLPPCPDPTPLEHAAYHARETFSEALELDRVSNRQFAAVIDRNERRVRVWRDSGREYAPLLVCWVLRLPGLLFVILKLVELAERKIAAGDYDDRDIVQCRSLRRAA